MLNRDSGPTTVYSVLVTVEIEDGVASPEQVMNRLADGVSFIEGCYVLSVDNFGTIDTREEDEPDFV